MIIIHIITILSLLIYLTSLVIFRWGLNYPNQKKTAELPTVSIIVAVKNEANYLPHLIEQLTAQNYPADKLEVIIVDNDSSDKTPLILQREASKYSNLRVFTTKVEKTFYSHKKAALAVGVREAHGAIILMTDADCRVGKNWALAMASYFTNEVGIVVGFSAIQPLADWFTRIQALDYLLLLTAAQGSINLGFAGACSGSNWAFRKVLFERVGGYMLIQDRIGGDDSLFMQVMQKRINAKVVFAAEEAAWVETEAVTSISTFFRQRIRWASEANYTHHLNRLFFGVILATFLANLMPIVYLILWIIGAVSFAPFFWMVLLKLLGEGMLFRKAVGIYKKQSLKSVFPIWFILQPFYIVLMGILGIWGNRLDWSHRSSSPDAV